MNYIYWSLSPQQSHWFPTKILEPGNCISYQHGSHVQSSEGEVSWHGFIVVSLDRKSDSKCKYWYIPDDSSRIWSTWFTMLCKLCLTICSQGKLQWIWSSHHRNNFEIILCTWLAEFGIYKRRCQSVFQMN